MERITLFADVLLPISLPGYFTYRVPFELNNIIKPGQQVVVQFGKKKIYTALVRKIHTTAPPINDIKYILSILEVEALIYEKQFLLWEWIASYYMCTPGEVMNAALPSALKLTSETKIILNPSFDGDVSLLNEKELMTTEALTHQKELTLTDLAKLIEQKTVIPLIKNLIEKKIIIVKEEITNTYKPKTEWYVKLEEKYKDEKLLKEIFDQLEKRAPKQLEILMYIYSKTTSLNDKTHRIKKAVMLKELNTSVAQLNSLIKKGVCTQFELEISRLENFEKTD
ncbi:MAG TPA: primosomal protein N', partial [Bacteroidales bacterium]|nr:primosomal protein N' [Bacteroidales bacterium]